MAPSVIFSWGANANGQCCSGQEGTETEWKPRCVNVAISRGIVPGTPISSVACGEAHTLILTGYGDVYACGRAREGQLGLGSCIENEIREPRIIEGLRKWHMAFIACGSKHSMAITISGTAFEWGLLLPRDRGACDETWGTRRSGLGKDFNEDLNERQRRIVAESWSTYLKNSKGSEEEEFDTTAAVSIWTDAEARRVSSASPRPCAGLQGAVAKAAACGFGHSVIISDTGKLYSAGYSEKGQLGNGERCPRASFALVALPEGLSVAFADVNGTSRALVDCGMNHTAVVTAPGGKLYTWGLGVFGQLGLGHDRKECCKPTEVDLPARVVQIACGDNHTVALTSEAELFTFGHRDAVGGQSHYQRLPEKKQELSQGSGEQVEALFAGGTGSFAILKMGKADRHPSLQAWGFNQRCQLGRWTLAFLELLRPGPVALPPLPGASVRAFSAGSSHCMAVLDTPTCCVLTPDVGEPFFGNPFLQLALRGDSPYDVEVLTGGARLGAHRCILRARCPQLAKRLSERAEGMWELKLQGHSHRCIGALLEYLYSDNCRMGADVGAELRALAEDLGLQRLMAGIAVATETESVAVGMRWVRTSDGRWEQVEEELSEGSALDAASKYAQDLEALIQDGDVPGQCEPDFVELVIRQTDGAETRTLRVGRPLLLTVEFFRAFLEGGFSEAVSLRCGASRAELSADSVHAFVLCLRILATGNYDLLPEDPDEALAVLAEAHRLQLSNLVAAAEAALGRAAASGRLSKGQLEALADAARLFDLPRLAGAGMTSGADEGLAPTELEA